MNAMLLLWFLIGMSAGGSHIWLLRRASQPPFHGAAWQLPRSLVSGGVLFASAVWGRLLPAVAGWTIAYFTAVGVVAIRSAA